MSTLSKILLTGFVVLIGTLFLWKPLQSMTGKGKADKDQIINLKQEKNNETYSVVNKWDLPSQLLEVSGITWISENVFACVQDEDGIVFFYNTGKGKIENQIKFAGPGDYEGITLAGNALFVMRADGLLYKIDNYAAKEQKVTQFQTHLTVSQDVEGLTFDHKQNRLLAAIKSYETGNQDYKGIYSFDLSTNTMNKEPVYKLNLKDKAFETTSSKKKKKSVQPSEVAVHPVTNDIYITEASGPSLIILSPSGVYKKTYTLNSKQFNQPEGITFSTDGKMYISNEGKKEPGNILEVQLTD